MKFHVGKNVLELSVADLEQHVFLLVQDSRESSPAVSASERPLPCSRHWVFKLSIYSNQSVVSLKGQCHEIST
jgi:hypothetical protein